MQSCDSAQTRSLYTNHNVILTLVVRGIDALSSGIWNGAALAAYIYIVQGNSNKSVGIAEGVFGTACAAAGLPAGWLSDKFRRDRVLRCASVIMVVAIATTAAAVVLPHRLISIAGHDIDSRVVLLVMAMVLWGVSEGGGPVIESIFADSVPTGDRARIYTLAFTIYVVNSSAGQFIAAGIFYWNGNIWSLRLLGLVILAGLTVAMVPAICTSLFNDDKTLGDESEALLHHRSTCDVEGDESPQGAVERQSWSRVTFLVPAVLLASDAVFGLAAGMTVKFFPLFFKDMVKLSPGVTNIVMASVPLALAPLAFLSQRISKYIGRVQTILAFESVGVAMMAIMGVYPSLWSRSHLIVPIMILRSACNNCCYPLQKSLLMDYVPKETRGRWNSLDSVLAFGWCGSAVAGGFLLDAYGFDSTFCITATFQAVGMLGLIPLIFILRRADREQQLRHQRSRGTEGEGDDMGDSLLTPQNENEDVEGAVEGAAVAAAEAMMVGPRLETHVMGVRASLERERFFNASL